MIAVKPKLSFGKLLAGRPPGPHKHEDSCTRDGQPLSQQGNMVTVENDAVASSLAEQCASIGQEWDFDDPPGEVYPDGARLAPAMISTPGLRVLRRRQRRALPAWFSLWPVLAGGVLDLAAPHPFRYR